MALVFRVTGTDIVTQTSSGYTIEKLAGGTTLDVPLGAAATLTAEFAAATKANGYMSIEIFDKDDNSVVAIESKGQFGGLLGPSAPQYPSDEFWTTLKVFLSTNAVESVSAPATDVDSQETDVAVAMSTTSYSTGKAVMTLSGRQPKRLGGVGASARLIASNNPDPANPGIYLLALGQATNNTIVNSGHMEITINFEVVDV